jgi:uncharacterized Zn-finger protein
MSNTTKPFVCTHDGCHSSFSFQTGLRNHVQIKHENPEIFRCEQCDYTTPYSHLIKNHITAKHTRTEDRPSFCCTYPECEKRFTQAVALKSHVRACHEMETFRCPEPGCSHQSKYKATLRNHMAMHKKLGALQAPKASSFSSEGSSPTRYYEESLVFACDQCDKVYVNKGALNVHKKKKHRMFTEVFKCDKCEFLTPYKSSLESHKLTHLTEKDLPYACEHPGCLKRFAQSSNRTRHMRVHTGERPYVCDFSGCNKSFSSGGDLQKHKRMHTGEKPFVCNHVDDVTGEVCGFSTTSSGNLTGHKLCHDGERAFACQEEGCSYRSKTRGDLVKHQVVHFSRYEFECKVEGCDKSYKTQHDLDKHFSAMHVERERFFCPEEGCSMSFKEESFLVRHALVHTGERPFECPTCQSRSRSLGDLKQHMLIHRVEFTFKCDFPMCDFACHQRGNFERHWSVMHSEGASQRKKIQEERISILLEAEGISASREVKIHFCDSGPDGGKYASLDFVIDNEKLVIIVSVDEYQHQSYGISCETKRIENVTTSLMLGGDQRPIYWIRYNPHSFKVDDSTLTVRSTSKEAALLTKLFSILGGKEHVREGLSLCYMFYDTLDGYPRISSFPEYNQELAKSIVSTCVTGVDDYAWRCGIEGCEHREVGISSISLHRNTHEKKSLQCKRCSYTCVKKESLLTHMQVYHSNERPFGCNEVGCRERFKRNAHLKRHMMVVHGKKL